MRRSDREIKDKAEIIAVIDKCNVCRLALSHDNIPYVIPMNFGYEYLAKEDRLTLYFHSANEGKKLDIMRENPNACFEMDCSHKLIEAEEAWGYSMEFESVIGNGTLSLCTEREEKIKGLSVLMKNYARDREFQFPDTVLKAVTVFKLTVTGFTGKRHKKS